MSLLIRVCQQKLCLLHCIILSVGLLHVCYTCHNNNINVDVTTVYSVCCLLKYGLAENGTHPGTARKSAIHRYLLLMQDLYYCEWLLLEQAGRRLDFTPSPNFVAMATRVSPTTFCMIPLNRPSPKTP